MSGTQKIDAIRQRIAAERRIAKSLHDGIKNRENLQARLRVVIETFDHVDAWITKRKNFDALGSVWIDRLQLIVMIAVDERLNIERILNTKGYTAAKFTDRQPTAQIS